MSEGNSLEQSQVHIAVAKSIEGQKPSWKNALSRKFLGKQQASQKPVPETSNPASISIEINPDLTEMFQKKVVNTNIQEKIRNQFDIPAIHIVSKNEIVGQLKGEATEIVNTVMALQEKPTVTIPVEYQNTVRTTDVYGKPITLSRTGLQVIVDYGIKSSKMTIYPNFENPETEPVRREVIGISKATGGQYEVFFLDGKRTRVPVPNMTDSRLTHEQRDFLESQYERVTTGRITDPLLPNITAVQFVDKQEGRELFKAQEKGELMFITTTSERNNGHYTGYTNYFVGVQERVPSQNQRIPDVKNIRTQFVTESELKQLFRQTVIPAPALSQ